MVAAIIRGLINNPPPLLCHHVFLLSQADTGATKIPHKLRTLVGLLLGAVPVKVMPL